jgi:predicted nucleic acid-binding protein
VSEIAEKIGKSKTSVYNRINKLKVELKPYQKTLNGVIYYDEEGFEIIKNSYENVSSSFKGVNKPTNNLESDLLDCLLSEKDKRIEELKKQLEDKDKALTKALDLADRTQHLLAMEKKEKQMLLELPQEPVRKSIWNIFKKSQPNSSWDSEKE